MTIVNAVNSNATGFIDNMIPAIPADVVNKAYADLISAGFTFKEAAEASTTLPLTVTYSNGASGVGATLTNAGIQAAFATDGYTANLNDRILVQFQASSFQNGIYSVTNQGSGSTNWVLTRTTDYDTPGQIVPGSMVPVLNGTLYGGTFWAEQATVTTVGTSPIIFAQFGANSAEFLLKANNLSDVANAATSRLNLGLTNVAIQTTTQFSPIVGSAANGLTSLTPLTNGQVVIGSTGANPVPASITAGSGITITPGAGSLTIAATPSGVLSVPNGGTGDSTLTAHAVLVGEGTSPINEIGPGVAGQLLQSGGPAADPAYTAATYPSSTVSGQLLYSSAGNIVSGLTSAVSGMLVTNSSGAPSWTSTMTNGQVVLGNTGGLPTAASITAGAGISITPGAGTLTIASNLGTPVSVANGGTGDTSLSAHCVMVGEGTSPVNLIGPGSVNQVLMSGGALADPFYSATTYPTTVSVNSLLYSSGSNVISGLPPQANAVLVSSATDQPFWSSPMTNGQIIIGSTGTPPVAATLTAGANITITNAANSITIASTAAASFTWNPVSTATNMVANNGYIATAPVVLTLPTTAAQGTIIEVVALTGQSWQVAQNLGQSIVFGNDTSTVGTGGSVASSLGGDAIRMVCTTANTTWYVLSNVGNSIVT